MPLALGGVYRWAVVVPRDAQQALAGRIGAEVRSVLAETSLPGLSFPGAAEGTVVLPWSDIIHLPSERRADFANACAKLPGELDGVRAVPALGRAAAICSLLLGEHGRARDIWERVVASGAEPQVAEAKVGLALLAIEQGLSSTDPQDRAFAWDRAEGLLRAASLDAASAEAARRNLEALEGLRELAARGLLGSEPEGGQAIGEN
jgi:hypothetical protein